MADMHAIFTGGKVQLVKEELAVWTRYAKIRKVEYLLDGEVGHFGKLDLRLDSPGRTGRGPGILDKRPPNLR